MADLDQLEEMILAVERAYLPLPALADRVAAAEQSLAMFWNALGQNMATPTPTPTPTTTIYPCCDPITPNSTINFVDSLWGSGTMTYDPGSGAWTGWLSGLSYPGFGVCTAKTIAINYNYNPIAGGVGTIQVNWIVNTTSNCPVNSTPTSTPGAGESFASTVISPIYGCDSTPVTANGFMDNGGPAVILRSNAPANSITVSFTGTTAPHKVPNPFGCGISCSPTTYTLVDSVYGSVPIVWNGINWVGTHSGLAYPGNLVVPVCAAGTISITYTLRTNAAINVAWHVTGDCPTAGTPNFNQDFGGGGASIVCTGTPHIITTNNSAANKPKALRASVVSQTFRVDI
jgi:hypothetical protein